MYFRKFLVAAASSALLMLNATAYASASTGTAYFDLSALTSKLSSDTSNFSGWVYQSEGAVQSGGSGESLNAAAPDLSASAGAEAKAYTHAASIGVEAQKGDVSNAFQRINTTFELAVGQHFVYSVPITMSITQQSPAQRIDLGIAFRFETLQTDGGSGLTYSTADWNKQSSSGTVSNFLEIDVTNFADTPTTVTLSAFLRADNYLAAPVPEPSTYIMLLGGLAGIAALGRRRRARRTP